MTQSRCRLSARSERLLVTVAVLLLVAQHLSIGLRSGFLPCALDCGETYNAHVGAVNLARLGWRYAGGLHDLAVGERPDAHPTLYIHNPNIALYFEYLLLRLGVQDVHRQAAWAVLPFGAGLAYMYVFLRAAARSRLFAVICLFNASTLYMLVSLWGFNPLRGFSWLFTFAPAYHLYRASRARAQLAHRLAASVFLALSFGIDYPFAVFCLLHVLGLCGFRIVRLPRPRLVLFLLVAFGVPFVLRQVQVAAVVGPTFWFTDFTYSLARRIGGLGSLATVPDEVALEALYRSHGVMVWPGTGRFAPVAAAMTVGKAYYEVLGVPLLVAIVAWAAASVAVAVVGARTASRILGPAIVRAVAIIASLVAAQLMTLVLFGDYVAGFYGKALMPLWVHAIVPMFGLLTYVLLANVRRVLRIGRVAIPVTAALFALFLCWRLAVEVRNHRQLPPRAYPGHDVLRRLHGQSVAALWDSSVVSAYTEAWAASLQPHWWARPELPPFDPSRDYHVFFQADRDNPEYRRPHFLFVPAMNVSALESSRCPVFHRRIATYAADCVDLDAIAARLAGWPLVERGRDYLLYDLRAGPSSPPGGR
jgi:hypothetical protein